MQHVVMFLNEEMFLCTCVSACIPLSKSSADKVKVLLINCQLVFSVSWVFCPCFKLNGYLLLYWTLLF